MVARHARAALGIAVAGLLALGATAAHADTVEQVMRELAREHQYTLDDFELNINYLRSMGLADKTAVPGGGRYAQAMISPGFKDPGVFLVKFYDIPYDAASVRRVSCAMGTCELVQAQ